MCAHHRVCRAQDTPAVKSTYSARVRCPAPLQALMSAVQEEQPAAGEAT